MAKAGPTRNCLSFCPLPIPLKRERESLSAIALAEVFE